MNKPKVYLCARVSNDAHKTNNEICDLLSPFFQVFAPHKKEAELRSIKDPVEIYNLDIEGMNSADICVTIAPYGKDCSWEMGYFVGRGKPIYMYVPTVDALPDKEWMISEGLTVIITDCEKVARKAARSDFNYTVLYSRNSLIGAVLTKFYNKTKKVVISEL
jgi:nucleoside 2-deoxyribosyltransferase